MCKYCKLKPGVPGEWCNEVQNIGRLKEGHTSFEVNINRYVLDDEDYHNGELILEQCVRLSDGAHTVQQTIISIKYCPFCGEKL